MYICLSVLISRHNLEKRNEIENTFLSSSNLIKNGQMMIRMEWRELLLFMDLNSFVTWNCTTKSCTTIIWNGPSSNAVGRVSSSTFWQTSGGNQWRHFPFSHPQQPVLSRRQLLIHSWTIERLLSISTVEDNSWIQRWSVSLHSLHVPN